VQDVAERGSRPPLFDEHYPEEPRGPYRRLKGGYSTAEKSCSMYLMVSRLPNTKLSKFRFRALLTEGPTEVQLALS
jgi:hypothetical protein